MADINLANFSVELLTIIVNKLSIVEDSVANIINFVRVCKSWKSVILNLKSEEKPFLLKLIDEEKQWLPPKYPWLLLAEPTANIPFKWDDDGDHNDDDDEDNNDDEDDWDEGNGHGDDHKNDDEEEENNDIDGGEEGDGDNRHHEEDKNGNADNDEEDNDDEDNNGNADNVGDNDMEDKNGNADNDDADNDEENNGNADNIGDDDDDEDGHDNADGGDGNQDGHDNVDGDEWEENDYNYKNTSIGSVRGLFSLSIRKTHVFSLPEAAGRIITGTNKGWLVTLGRDLQMNLLHPLLRRQIPLPPMLTFPTLEEYDENYTAESATEFFLHKVVLSSRILLPNLHVDVSPPPTVMAIYGTKTKLGFAKLGDKSWTDVNGPWGNFYDILYHKERFYAVDCFGHIYVCDISNDREGGPIATKITSFPGTHIHENHKYLVESLCGSYIYLVVRVRTFGQGIYKYLTTKFSVWKFQVDYADSNIPSFKWEKVTGLKNNALFVGRTSSVCVQATECIKRNCIYFTDDYMEAFVREEGGYDMGIYNLKTGTIKPHFRGLSIHPLSPPIWYM